MNFDNLINDYFSKIYSGNVNEFNKFIHNNNLSINITNKNKENALHVVIKSDLSDIVKINFIKYLISKNININDKDCVGNTPFNLACQKQLFNIMIVLYNHFKNKINLYDKNKYNLSPISYILKGQIVDEIDDYSSPIKFIKKDSEPQINDVSKLLDAVKNYVKNQNLFTNICKNLIEIIKKNINFELQINKSLVDIKIDEFKKKIIQNKNDLSADFKYEFYNDIFNIIKKSHPNTLEPINFESTKSLDNDGFYLKKNDGTNTDYKIHGEITFYQNLEKIKQNNLIFIRDQVSKSFEIESSLDPKKFFFSFFEEIAHNYYCKQFSENIDQLLNSDNDKCKEKSNIYQTQFGNKLNDFIEYINSLNKDNKIIKIASGHNHNLILTSKGQVYSFGDNTYGQCGFDNNANANIDTPRLIDGTGDFQGNINYNNDPNFPKPGKIKDIACGEFHSLILNMKGQVFAFGDNTNGQCGYQGNNGNKWFPYKIQDSKYFKNKNFISIACGANHNLLLSENKTVFTFGDNLFGQLGKNINLNNHIPYEIQGFIIEKIACGYFHSIIIDINGVVRSFGNNSYGQLGTNRHIDLINEQVIQQGAFGIRTEGFEINRNIISIIKGTGSNNFYGKIIDVACGKLHTLILNEKNEVFSFGDNQFGQLGFTFNINNYIYVNFNNFNFNDQQIKPKLKQYIIDNAKKNQTDNRQNFYINLFKRNTNNIEQPLPIIDTLNNPKYHDNKNFGKIKSIACGRNHSIIINDLGMVFTFGKFNNNRLGHQNVNNNLFSPKLITGTGSPKYGKIIMASAGNRHTLILNNYSHIFSFGNNLNSKLGISDNALIGKISLDIDNTSTPDSKDYIIRDNTLFKNFTITINDLLDVCKASIYILIKNIVTKEEIFVYNKYDDYEIVPNIYKNLKNLYLEIKINNNKLELKLNNKKFGEGQFEIKFYNNNFDQINKIDIKTNEYNEPIDTFFENKLNYIYQQYKSIFKFDTINFVYLVKFYNELNDLDIYEINKKFIELKRDLNFIINETYFDKSKLNINYMKKYFEKIKNFKSLLLSSIDEYELFIKSKLNKQLIKDFNYNLECDENISLNKFSLSDEFIIILNYINNLKKLNIDKNFYKDLLNKDFVNYEIVGDKENYLISPAYQDFYFYFRYHILEKIIIDNLNILNQDDIKDELNKIFDYYYYDYDGDNDDDEIFAAKLAIIGDVLDNLLINKIRNVIFNEINFFVKEKINKIRKKIFDDINLDFEPKDIKTFDIDLINMNNEFDLDLSKMNDKIKNVLQDKINYNDNIKNRLRYNLGNVLINNVEVPPVLYYPNNFFDINFNKQQFILYNEKLKNELKDIKLDYDLTKSLIENQNNTLIENLKKKIILDNHKIRKLIDYIQKNKIDNNKYNYSDFCENYNYHLEEELKKFQNHKNIFKYYNYLIDIFIYFYKSTSDLDNLDNDESLKDDLEDSLESTIQNYNIDNSSDNTKIKKYSKTYIVKLIKDKFNKKFFNVKVEIKYSNENIYNLEKMLFESKDVDGDSNSQLKKEFISICLAIDLILGNMYSKLLKRFLLEYLTDKYESEINNDNDLFKLKIIISNIMTNVDKLINTNFEFKNIDFTNFDLNKLTEFTKKLVILHSEGRYKIKEYVELDEDNLFMEIVNLIKSNSYEKIEEDDIVLTYLKDNINDYFKKYYKLAIKTLIACSSGLNNYILYHNKFKNIKELLDNKFKDNENEIKKNKKAKENKIKNKEYILEAFTNKDKPRITSINNNYKKKIKNIMKIFKKS